MDLPSETSTSKQYKFLSGGGKMGAAIQIFDWSPTVIGSIERWPQTLRTSVGIVVQSKVPMFLSWGDDALCIFNDASESLITSENSELSLGKLAKDIWPAKWSEIKSILNEIRNDENHYLINDPIIPVYNQIDQKPYFFNCVPVYNENDEIGGLLLTLSTTGNEHVKSTQKSLIDKRFNTFVQQANVGIIIFHGMEMIVDLVNESYAKIVGYTVAELTGNPFFDVIPDAATVFRPLLTKVLTTGEPLYMYETPFIITVKGKEVNGYVDLVYQPARDFNDQIIGVTAFIVDVTDKVIARKQIEDTANQLQFATESAELATWDYNPKSGKFSGNERLKEWFGFDSKDNIDLNQALIAIDENDRERVSNSIALALQSDGNAGYYEDYSIINSKTGERRVVRSIGKSFFDESQIAYRFSGTMQDVTQQVAAAQKIIESEEQLRSIVESAMLPIGVFVGKDMRIFMANKSLMNIWGKGDKIVGKLYAEVLPEIKDTVIYSQIMSVYETGIPFNANNSRVDLLVDGKMRIGYYNYNFTPLRNPSGEIYGIITTASEVTDIVSAKQKVEQSEKHLRSLIEQSPIATTLLVGKDLIVSIANDTMIRYWGKGPNIIGKPVNELLPELESEAYMQVLKKVYETGVTEIGTNSEAHFVIDGRVELFYLDITFKAMRNANNEIFAVLCSAIDVTDQVINRKKLEESEHFARSIIHNSVVAQAVFTGENLVITTINPQMLELLARDNSIIGKPFLNAMPELIETPLLGKVLKVLKTGESYFDQEDRFELIKDGQVHVGYYNYTYQAIRNADGEIYGVLVSANEVTTQVLARKKIEDSEQRVRSLIEAAPIAIGVFVGRDLVIETHNHTFLDIVGKGDNTTGLPLREAMPELITEGQPFLKILDDVFTTGIKYQTFGTQVKIVQNGVMTYNFYDFTYTPIRDANGEVYAVLDIAIDVTENVKAQDRIAESEINLRNTILQSPVAMCILKGKNQVVEIANELMLGLWGTDETIINKSIFDGLPEAKEQGFDLLLDQVYTTGETYRAYDVAINLPRKDLPETVYVNFVYEAFRAPDNTISGVLVIAIDVTRQVLAREKIEEAEEKARLAIESADLGTYEVNLITDELKTSDRFNEIWGTNPQLSRESRANAIHPDDRGIRSQAHKDSLLTGNLDYEVRLLHDDKSERWVRVKGKVLYDEQGNPMTLLGIIQEITEQKHFTQQLSKLVDERTTELNRSNEDLLQFAHIASHDLKEPVRKIKVFSTMLQDQFGALLPEKGHLYLQKVQNATERMFSMIEGILTYSAVNASDQPIEKIDVNEIIESIEMDLEVAISRKNAKIIFSDLPVIEGATVLIYQLFYNLINNALKFTKPDTIPEIIITATEINKDGNAYAEIKVSDNGIGISSQYAEQIFTAFVRLHAKDKFEGTGLGLALCKKIVERHNGTISASGRLEVGTEFTIILPLNQTQKFF